MAFGVVFVVGREWGSMSQTQSTLQKTKTVKETKDFKQLGFGCLLACLVFYYLIVLMIIINIWQVLKILKPFVFLTQL